MIAMLNIDDFPKLIFYFIDCGGERTIDLALCLRPLDQQFFRDFGKDKIQINFIRMEKLNGKHHGIRRIKKAPPVAHFFPIKRKIIFLQRKL